MHIFLRLFVFYKYILYICTVTNYKMMIDYRKTTLLFSCMNIGIKTINPALQYWARAS